MVRNLSIRSRILAVLALPVLVLVAAASVLSWTSFGAARDATQLQRAVQAARELPALVEALDVERTASTALLDSDSDATQAAAADLSQARAQTDPLLAQITQALRQVDTDRLDPDAARAVAAAVESARQVKDVRSVVDQGQQSATLVSASYETAIGAQSELPAALAADTRGAGADALRASTSLQQLVGLLADERDVGTRALQTGGGVDSAERTSLVGIAAQISSTRSEAVGLARSAGVQVPPPGVAIAQLRAAVEGDPGAGFTLPSVESWRTALDAETAALDPSAQALAAASADAVASDAATARTTALAVALGALAAVIVPLLVALLIARSITEPLRALTRAAGDVRSQLPRLVEAAHGEGGATPQVAELQPIPVRSRDEVGRLAVAFNEVNATSVRVAREQAALRAAIASSFVTVARRDQALLNRQLAFIDTLERAEEDPKTLEDLFTLDHLATRMRRNAESLLVLAGIDGGRRLRAPMPLSDVVRTASSEIEDYRRIDLALGADPAVLGHLALPAAHLLAELLENATRSSDPVTRVRVTTAPLPSGVLLTVTDEGIGMSPEQRAEAVARIADPSATAAVGASELGYFVVGRIARRLGAQVEIHAGAARGTVVAVSLPAAVFAGAVEAVAPDQTGSQPALPVRGPATGALPVVRLPETRAASNPALAAPAAAAPARALPAATPVATPAPAATPGRLPRRVPRTPQPAVSAAAAGGRARPATPAPPGDPEVARRSSVFRTFTARRGQLEPVPAADSMADGAVDIDLTAPAAGQAPSGPLTPLTTVPAFGAGAPYEPDETAFSDVTPLPSRDQERTRGAHASPKRGLFGRRPSGSTDQQPAVPEAPEAEEVAEAPDVPAVASQSAPHSGVRPMTRRELRALEASGQVPRVQANGPSGPSGPSKAAPPQAPPLVPLAPAASVVARQKLPTLPPMVSPTSVEVPFRPATTTVAASAAALPRRSPAAPATPATSDGPAVSAATAERAPGWLAQRAAPLRPLPKMPPAAPSGRLHAVEAAFHTEFHTEEQPREAYRPAAVAAGAGPLARRAPAAPAGAGTRPSGGQHPPRRREPAEVRSMLAGYTSGVSRARRTPRSEARADQSHTAGAPHAPDPQHAPDHQEER